MYIFELDARSSHAIPSHVMHSARPRSLRLRVSTYRRVRNHVRCRHSARNLNAIISSVEPEDAPKFASIPSTAKGEGLRGKSIAVKDNITTLSPLRTTAASKILEPHISPYEATVVALLREHGAHITSKTNLDEFGMGSHSQHTHFDPVSSPFSRGGVVLSPGGSSGGSAVAVALGKAFAALGTDTGGSVRLPAAYCGVVGFKPTYGRVSRWGVLQYAHSLDTVGVLARDVVNVDTVFEAIDRFDKNDPTSLSPSLRKRISDQNAFQGGDRPGVDRPWRIGIPIDYNIQELSPVAKDAYVEVLRKLQTAAGVGFSFHSVSLPSTRQALSAYYILAPVEASSNLAKYDGIRYGFRAPNEQDDDRAYRPEEKQKKLPLYARTRGVGFGAEVQRRILLGTYSLSSDAKENFFVQAQKIRRLVQMDFDAIFARPNPLHDGLREEDYFTASAAKVDILLTPTSPTLPPTVTEIERQGSSVESYVNDVFTVPASLAGLPALSVPVPLSNKMVEHMDPSDVRTISMQVIGQFGDDGNVLKFGKLLENMQMGL